MNGGLKYALNVYKGRLGEACCAGCAQLLGRILRFPLPQFRKLSQGELIAMVTGEVEALGGYFGDALVTPMFQAGLLLTALGFIFAQDLIMGLAAIALYPFQAYVIPKLRRQVNLLGFDRIREVRRLSQRIGEVTGVIEDVTLLRPDPTGELGAASRSDLQDPLRHLSEEVLHQVPEQLHRPAHPILLPVDRRLSGAARQPDPRVAGRRSRRVQGPGAALEGAPRLLPDPAGRADQVRSAAHPVRPAGPAPATRDRAAGRRGRRARGRHRADDLGLEDDGHVLLDQVSLKIPAGQHVALLNENGDGAQALFRMLARLAGPTSGRLMLDGQELSAVPRASYARQVAVVPSPARLTQGTVAENLLLRLGAAAGGASELALDETLATFDQVELAATCSSSACARSSIQSATARWSSGSRRPQRPP